MDTLDIWCLYEKSGIFNMMRKKLKSREEKQSWNNTIDDINLDLLIEHLILEFKELKEGIKKNDLDNIQEECADLANLCCFVYSKISLLCDVNNGK